MIIRNIGFLVCMLVVCSLNINTAMAQSRSYEGGITVNPVRLEQKGDSTGPSSCTRSWVILFMSI